MKRVVLFVAACNVVVVLALGIVWAAGGFAYLGLPSGIATALIIGIVATCEVAIGLMALIFYSEESGQDDTAYHVHRVDDSDRH